MPQAMVFALPVLCNNFIGLIKGSSIVYVIEIMDVLGGAMSSAQVSYRFLEAYIAAALVYWALCALSEAAFRSWEVKLAPQRFLNLNGASRPKIS
jgi:L-cystine transport system permease protein